MGLGSINTFCPITLKCDKISIEARIRENDGYERGLQEGINKGIDQGKLREQQAIAKRMKSRDMDITEISDITGLSTDEIEKL